MRNEVFSFHYTMMFKTIHFINFAVLRQSELARPGSSLRCNTKATQLCLRGLPTANKREVGVLRMRIADIQIF